MSRWDRLGGLVEGRVQLPGESGFAEASRSVNARYHGVQPAAVLAPSHPGDVSKAIKWSREALVPVVARGGGHSYAGHSVNQGLVLDLRGLNDVHVDPATAQVTVGGGTLMRKLYAQLRAHDLVLPLGNSYDVGIGGLALGGGVSVVSRAFGLTCDSLISTDVVLADGRLVACNEREEAELFWGCRGGGGGNFGVNTSFTFQARPVPSTSTCLLLWHRSQAMDVLTIMQEVMRCAPDSFSARIGVNRAGCGETVVSVIGQHLGPANELAQLLEPAITAAPPNRLEIEDRNYWEAVEYLHHDTAGGAFAVRTRCTPEPLAEEGLRTLLDAVDRWPGSENSDGAGFALFAWGGAINRVPASHSAFPHRNTLFLLSMDTSWQADESSDVQLRNLRWLADLYDDMGQYATDSSYLNFADPDLSDWQHAYYGDNAARLLQVKRRYDPDRVFSFSQGI